MGTSAFEQFHKLVDTVLRVDFTQKMNVVGHNFEFNNLNPLFYGGLLNNFFQTQILSANQDFPAIFRTPDNMVVATKCDVVIALEFIFRTYVLIIRL